MNKQMKAIGLYKYLPVTDPECLVDVTIDRPKATGQDLLVEVKAVSINPVDTKVRSPKMQTESFPKILGWDAAGVVVEVGEDVTNFEVGDEVYYAGSILRPGCNSEYHLVDERIVGKKPKSLSFAEAAALPLTTITAWEALFEKMDIYPEDSLANNNRSILIISGAGGVGSIAIQLAKKVAGMGTVIATAGRSESQSWTLKMGADTCIAYHNGIKKGLEEAGMKEVDYILCLNSTEQHFKEMAEIIKPFGKICSIISTKNGVPLDMNLLFGKSVTFAWELMFTKSSFQTEDIFSQGQLLNSVSDLIDKGKITTTLNSIMGMINAKNLKEAHHKIEQGDTIGKLVLEGF